jgi:hypothetical protein
MMRSRTTTRRGLKPTILKRPRPVLSKETANFLEENQRAHMAVIAQGPLVPFYGLANEKNRAGPETLPRCPFRLYDEDGNETSFSFETDAIFSFSVSGRADRVFYDEINEVRFTPIAGWEDAYSQMTFRTTVGFRTFFYFPREYEAFIHRIINRRG